MEYKKEINNIGFTAVKETYSNIDYMAVNGYFKTGGISLDVGFLIQLKQWNDDNFIFSTYLKSLNYMVKNI